MPHPIPRRFNLKSAFVALVFAAAALVPIDRPARAAGDGCDPAKLKHAKVIAACKAGGKKAVVGLMKQVVKDAGKAGNRITCESCHTELQRFGRKPNAASDLAKYLAP